MQTAREKIKEGTLTKELKEELRTVIKDSFLGEFQNEMRKKEEPYKNIIIAGGGKIGSRLAKRIENDHRVKIIESDHDRAKRLSEKLEQTIVLEGNVCDKHLLHEENIEGTDVFAAVTNDDDIVILDCKASFDDNALYRQRAVAEMKDENEYDPLELEAARHDLNYVKLDGNIGLMVNGAGLSMATMDIIKYYGGEAANFMDVAGAATPERVAAAFKLIYKDPDVQGILINIFGGMMRCNDIATGLVNASKEVGLNKPLVVRLEGTNVDMGKEILINSGFPIKPVDTMEQAAQDVVKMVKENR